MASTSNGNRINRESPYSMLSTTTNTTNSSTSTLQTRSSPSPPDTRMTSLVDISYLQQQSNHQQQHQESYSIHNGTESGLLQAPRPQFLSKSSNNNIQNNSSNNNNNSNYNSRPSSFASSSASSRGSSGGGGRVQLQSTNLSYMRNGSTNGESSLTTSMSELELREEAVREGLTVPRSRDNQYNSERPLETVNRLSRMWDTVPAASLSPQSAASTSTANRRVSRLPLAVGGFDPFGYGVSTESSPYDSALAYSNSPKNRMSSRASWYPSSDENGSLVNVANSNSFVGLAMLNQFQGSTSGSTTDLNKTSEAPWSEKKRRSVSLGEMGRDGRSALRNSFLSGGRSGSGPSKLSGEIGVENESQSLASMGLPVSKGFVPPADQDFIKSKLYQRTLKAQKSLDKERARKGIPTGQRSVSDNTTSKSNKYADESHGTLQSRRKSGASFTSAVSASDANSISGRSVISNSSGKKGGSFGWLRSKSDVAISSMVASPAVPPMPSPYKQNASLPPSRPFTSPRLNEPLQIDQDREVRSRSAQSRQSDHESQNQQRRPPSVPLPSPPLTNQEARSVPPSPSSSYRRNLPQNQQSNQPSRSNSPIIDYYSHQPRLSASYASQLPLPPSPGSDYFPLGHQSPQQSQQQPQYNQYNPAPTPPRHSPTPSHEPQLYMRERARSPLNTNTTHHQQEEVDDYHRPAPTPPTTSHRQPQASFEQDRDTRAGTESQMMENSSSGSSSTTSPITPLPSLESIHPVAIQEPETMLPPSRVSHQSVRSNQNYANNVIENSYYEDVSVDSTTPKKSKSSLNLFFSGLGGKKEEKTRRLGRAQPQIPQNSTSNFATTQISRTSSGGNNFFGRAKKSFVAPVSSTTSSSYTSSPSPPVKNSPLPPVPGNNIDLPKSKSFTFLSKPFSRSSSSSTISSKNTSSPGVLSRSRAPSAATRREYPSPQAVQESILLHSNRSNNSPSYTNVY